MGCDDDVVGKLVFWCWTRGGIGKLIGSSSLFGGWYGKEKSSSSSWKTLPKGGFDIKANGTLHIKGDQQTSLKLNHTPIKHIAIDSYEKP